MKGKSASSKLGFALLLSSLAPLASGHTYLTSLGINGTQLAEEKCIRPWWKNENYPVEDPNSSDLLCRTKDMTASATSMCGVAAGSNITIYWTESGTGSRAIDPSHLGPCLAYMAPLSSNGSGDVWFKIYEDGYDPATKLWCVDKIVKSKGYLDITIPADIAPGDYLLRTEIIALHEADRVYGADKSAGAQYYPNCAQLTISGTGTAQPQGYAIPGIYKPTDPGIHINIYDPMHSYTIPGPPKYVPGSVKNTNANIVSAASISNTQTVGASAKSSSSASLPMPTSPTAISVAPPVVNAGPSQTTAKKCSHRKSVRKCKHQRKARFHFEL
ncbi:glycosyl hydrolase family 61-domain-containing protein [Coemansia spiralis]|nr:glycosyl hydrolase family 61-domain-containing protein [Coemansia spiralis]